MGKSYDDLKYKQKKFIEYFLQTGSQIEAARLAGYKGEKSQGRRMYEKLRSYIDERLKPKEEALIASSDEVLIYLTNVMRGQIKEETVVVEGIGDGMSSARIIEKQVAIKDRNDAAKSLAKRYGLLTENINLSGDININIGIDDDE